MGIFSGLFKSRDKPENRTPGSSYAFYMGGSSAGKVVNERSAMQMTAVYACVRILSEAIAGLPLHMYRYKEDGGKEKALDQPLYLLLHDEPNPEMSSFVFRETLMTHLLLYGNAYAQIIRNGKGEIIGLYPLMANKMSVNRDTKGQLYYDEVVAAISAKEAQSERLADFIKVLKAQDGTISEFDGSLWGGMVEFVMVGRNKEITVTFRDGTEILA